jgi:hypothetical protein
VLGLLLVFFPGLLQFWSGAGIYGLFAVAYREPAKS